MCKSEMRKKMKQRKAACSKEELAALSAAVISHLESLEVWKKAQVVLLYHSLPDEVDTHALISRCSTSKRVLLPVVVGDDLELREYRPHAAMQSGSFGIQEPEGEAFTGYDAIDLAVIPGVAFTRYGDRLGRGKGYYDRLLPHLHNTFKLGLCWPFQIVPHIPTAPHDIRMDGLCSTLP